MGNQLGEHVEAYQGNTAYELDNHVLLNWYAQRVLALTQRRGSLLEPGLGHGHATSILGSCLDRVTLEGIFLKPITTQQLLSLKLDPRIIPARGVGIGYPEMCCGILAQLRSS